MTSPLTPEISSLNRYTFLFTLVSVVIGLGIAHIVTNWANLARGVLKFYGVQFIWSLNVFMFLVLYWWLLLRWVEHNQNLSFFLYLMILGFSVLLYLVSVFTFPLTLDEGNKDMKAFFFKNRRWFFSLIAVIPLMDILDTLMKGSLDERNRLYIPTMVFFSLLAFSGNLTANQRYHRVLGSSMLAGSLLLIYFFADK